VEKGSFSLINSSGYFEWLIIAELILQKKNFLHDYLEIAIPDSSPILLEKRIQGFQGSRVQGFLF